MEARTRKASGQLRVSRAATVSRSAGRVESLMPSMKEATACTGEAPLAAVENRCGRSGPVAEFLHESGFADLAAAPDRHRGSVLCGGDAVEALAQ